MIDYDKAHEAILMIKETFNWGSIPFWFDHPNSETAIFVKETLKNVGLNIKTVVSDREWMTVE